jgi:hypothetical protein
MVFTMFKASCQGGGHEEERDVLGILVSLYCTAVGYT